MWPLQTDTTVSRLTPANSVHHAEAAGDKVIKQMAIND